VEFLRNGRLERVPVGREVVLCGGPYNSPQILMLSGIGPADHLRSHGIPVVQDLKGIGENPQEHPNLLNIYRTGGKLGLSRHLRLDRAALEVIRWALFGTGPFATAGTIANIFTRTRPGLELPDIQIIAMPIHQHAELWFPWVTKPPVYAFTARVGILHALSRGWVRLRSSDPLDYPRIRFNMLTEQADMDAMARNCRPAVNGRRMRSWPRPSVNRRSTAITPSVLAAWARTSTQSPMRSCASSAARICGWPMPL
jgi:choline dehydrogenase